MSPLRVHPEPLPDEAVVIRGGMMKLADLRNSVETTYRATDTHGLSAWAGVTDAEILEAINNIYHRWVCITTAKRIRSAGYEVVLTGRPRHCTIKFEAQPTDEDLKSLTDEFDAAKPKKTIASQYGAHPS